MLTAEHAGMVVEDEDPRDPTSDRRKEYEKPVASPMSREDAEMLVDFKDPNHK